MKYFLDCDSMLLYKVPKKLWHLVDLINNRQSEDYEINSAKDEIVSKCKHFLKVDALTQTL